jgi:hypothetical protein
MTASQRGLIVRTLKRVSLALLTAGILAGAYVSYKAAGIPPGWRAFAPRGPDEVRDALSFALYLALPFMVGAVPFLLLSGIIWWIAGFIRAGGQPERTT